MFFFQVFLTIISKCLEINLFKQRALEKSSSQTDSLWPRDESIFVQNKTKSLTARGTQFQLYVLYMAVLNTKLFILLLFQFSQFSHALIMTQRYIKL